MKERPILFSGPMVRAILEGRKTQTRRTVKMTDRAAAALAEATRPQFGPTGWARWEARGQGWNAKCPHGGQGDRLWVKETIAWEGGPRAVYCADDAPCPIDTWPWKRPKLTAIHCPRGGSRITLEVADVRVQRLQEIVEDDARAEGVEPYTPPHGHISPDQRVPGPGFDRCRLGDQPHRLPFADLWDAINGKRCPWSSNPWVWAITFRRLDTEAA